MFFFYPMIEAVARFVKEAVAHKEETKRMWREQPSKPYTAKSHCS